MTPMESGNEILTIKEVCDLLQIHQSTVYEMARRRKILPPFGSAALAFHRAD